MEAFYLNTIASFTLDEKQYENVISFCNRFNMNLSEVLRIALKNAVRCKEDNVPSTYKSIKIGVRLAKNDIRMLAYVMRNYKIKTISEACRISLMILINQYSKEI